MRLLPLLVLALSLAACQGDPDPTLGPAVSPEVTEAASAPADTTSGKGQEESPRVAGTDVAVPDTAEQAAAPPDTAGQESPEIEGIASGASLVDSVAAAVVDALNERETDGLGLTALLGGLALLGVGLGLGFVLGRWRREASSKGGGRGEKGHSGGTRDWPPQSPSPMGRAALPDERGRPNAETLGLSDLQAEIRGLEDRLGRRLEQSVRPEPVVPTPTPRPRREPVRTPRAGQEADAIGAAFASWCETAGLAVSEQGRFASELAGAVPGASVRSVYRDRDSARRPVVFTEEREGSPAEYWAVESGGELWLLPFPQSPRQFRDLADGAFDGDRVPPKALRRARPARLRPADGSGYAVADPGLLA